MGKNSGNVTDGSEDEDEVETPSLRYINTWPQLEIRTMVFNDSRLSAPVTCGLGFMY